MKVKLKSVGWTSNSTPASFKTAAMLAVTNIGNKINNNNKKVI